MKKVEVNIAKAVPKAERVVYGRGEVLQRLMTGLEPVLPYAQEAIVGASKYVNLASHNTSTHYRLCRENDLIRLGVMDSFTHYQRAFFAENGAVIAIINTLAGKVVSAVFRSIEGKAFMDYSLFYTVYGLDLMREDFKFGDPVILTEGIYDADSLRPLFQDTLAMLTSNITASQGEVLRTLTNRFYVLFDCDDAGEMGFKKSLLRLGKSSVTRLSVFKGDKDIGKMEECRFAGDMYGFNERRTYYQEQIEQIRTDSGIDWI